MTINAAMPAVSQNMSYSGTAAAPDMTNGTASDFGGTLSNMMGTKESANTEAMTVSGSEMTMTEQHGDMQEAQNVIPVEQPELMSQLHKELMMKNAGYAHSELIAMLLNGSNAELTELMSFDSEEMVIDGIALQTEDTAMLTENAEAALTTAQDTVQTQTEAVDIIPDMAETQDAFAIPENKTVAQDNVTDMTEKPDAEQTTDTEVKTVQTEIADEDMDIVSDKPEVITTVRPETKMSDKTQVEISDKSESEATDVKEMTDNLTLSEKTEAHTSQKLQQSITTAQANEAVNPMIQTDDTVADSRNDTVADISVKDQENTAQAGQMTDKATLKITESTVSVKDTHSAKAENDNAAEQLPEAAEETADFEATFARAGKKISEKSEEALQLAKSISGTKSDSDLETKQKVTVKQELTDGGIMKNDVQSDVIVKDDVKAQAPVKMTVNEAYQIINERASENNGKQTFTVELTPETLGKITVKMTSEGGKLSVEILTETEAAKQLFEARANELADNLRQNDVQIGSYRVETENEQLFNESFDGSSKNPYAEKQQSESSDDEDEFERLISEMMGM